MRWCLPNSDVGEDESRGLCESGRQHEIADRRGKPIASICLEKQAISRFCYFPRGWKIIQHSANRFLDCDVDE